MNWQHICQIRNFTGWFTAQLLVWKCEILSFKMSSKISDFTDMLPIHKFTIKSRVYGFLHPVSARSALAVGSGPVWYPALVAICWFFDMKSRELQIHLYLNNHGVLYLLKHTYQFMPLQRNDYCALKRLSTIPIYWVYLIKICFVIWRLADLTSVLGGFHQFLSAYYYIIYPQRPLCLQ